jgi:hypothetical protein
MNSASSAWDPVAGFCGNDNEPSGSIKDGEFPDQPREYQLLIKD